MTTNIEFILSSFSACAVGSKRLGLVCVLLLAGGPAAWALDASEREFTWNEANAIMHTAVDPNDYLRAAQAYQKLVDAGARNGPLFYNLGAALLQAGRYDNALDALARAERYLGAQPDIRRNMLIALARKQKAKSVEWPWPRLLLFWHYNLPCPARAVVAVAAFALFWLALGLRRLGLRRGVDALAALALLVFVAFGSSAATSAHQELAAHRYQLDIPAAPPDKSP